MNETLKTQHIEQLIDPVARSLYDSLCAQYEKKHGDVEDGPQVLIFGVALAEQIKRKLTEDIKKRDVVETFRNGRQTVMRENKSVTQARYLMEQQRRNLSDLGMLPGPNKRTKPAGEDEAENDDEFDAFE